MKIKQAKNLTVLLIFTMILSAFSSIVFAEGAPGLELPVEVKVSSTPPTSDSKYIIILKAIYSSPMPEGSTDGKYKLSMPGDSTYKKFPKIKFPSVGIYYYEVYQSSETDKSYGHDNKVYNLKVYVINTEEDEGLKIIVKDKLTGEKVGDVVFNPEAKKPPPYDPPGGGPTVIITPDTPTKPKVPDKEVPKVPEEPEEEIEEEIPEAKPEIPEEPPEEEIEEEIPQAKPAMPKTGQVPATIYYAIGAALVGLGLGFRKKEDE